MMFDEQPDGDPHGECGLEIRKQADRIASLETLCRDLEVRLKAALEDARVTSEELGVRLAERDEASAEAQALRTLLLDCEMLETSDGKVHLRSDIKAAIDAARSAMPGSAPTEGKA